MSYINSMGTNETYAGAYRNKTEQRGVKAAQKARPENPEVKKYHDLKSITYRVDSIHDLTDFDRHLSDMSHEAAKLELLSSISALNYFADAYLLGDARDSFKSLIKDYKEYNSASVAKHENWSDLYADSMINIGAPNATGVKEAVWQVQERTKASQEIGRVTHTEEDEAKLYQDYQALFDKLAGGEGNINRFNNMFHYWPQLLKA